ncbi:Disintegrin and metalloproteinase domain-containing protein 22 [Cichlidogyrus casuarinus]|uniref:Disintegrin and metalloproteinase domain-containing protein 22 n=1 Tax=Cichlidogyrus casuarinus TaxID=1844966 RepID=A0ABD2PPV8_9PLAT
METAALCFAGRCPARDEQCQTIWGLGATRSHDACFLKLNQKTTGACGESGLPCSQRNALCGNLHCSGGSASPLHTSTDIFVGQDRFQCKYVERDGFVWDGTSCGINSFCLRNQCLPAQQLQQLQHTECLARSPFTHHTNQQLKNALAASSLAEQIQILDLMPFEYLSKYTNNTFAIDDVVVCSGRGVCRSDANCLCKPGWSGASCSTRGTPPQDEYRIAVEYFAQLKKPGCESCSQLDQISHQLKPFQLLD